MKIIILFTLMILLVGLQGVHAQSVNSSVTTGDIALVIVAQNPAQAGPGDIVDIDIEIQNNGFAAVKERVVEIIEKDPFTLVSGEDKSITFSSIPARSSVRVSYKIKISDTAVTNSYDLEFKIRPPLSDVFVKKSISLRVIGEPKLVIDDIRVDPTTIEPGGIADIFVTLRNAGTGKARQLQAEFIANSSEIVPILSGGLSYVDVLEAGENYVLPFKISIDTSAGFQTLESTILINYKDEENADSQESFTIGIPITGTIEIEIIKIEPNYERGVVRIEVANKGTTDAKSVEAKLYADGKLLGVDYTSQIKANKQTTFDFPLALSGMGELVINHIGPGLEKGEIRKDIVFDFGLQNGNGNGTSTTINIVILIIIIIAVYLFWRRKKKKKKK